MDDEVTGGIEKRAVDLRPGDVIETPTGPVELIDEPFIGCTGVSPFDHAELFVRARVRPLHSGGPCYATWGLGTVVSIRRP